MNSQDLLLELQQTAGLTEAFHTIHQTLYFDESLGLSDCEQPHNVLHPWDKRIRIAPRTGCPVLES